MSDRDNHSYSSGLSFTSVLQLIFIVLKLCKVIDWSWWIVMIPTFVDLGVVIIALIIAALISVISGRK